MDFCGVRIRLTPSFGGSIHLTRLRWCQPGSSVFFVCLCGKRLLSKRQFLMFCALRVLWLCDVVVFYPWQVVLKASHCWLQLLSETVKTIGLWTDSIEPCVYSGAVYDRDTHTPGTCLSHSLCRRHLACLVDGRGRSICRGHHFQGCSDQDHRTDSTGRRVAHIHWLNHPTSCSRR